VGSDWQAAGGVPSSTTYMASHRMQRHSVITSDGAIHIIVNTGTPSSYNGSAQTGTLQLYSSSDHGTTWVNTYTFPGTETSQQPGNYTVSTDDVALRTDRAGNQFLDVAYDQETAGGAAANALMFTELLYRSNASRTNTWRLAPNSSYSQMVNNPSYSATTFTRSPRSPRIKTAISGSRIWS